MHGTLETIGAMIRSPYWIMALFGAAAALVLLAHNQPAGLNQGARFARLCAFALALVLGACLSNIANWFIMDHWADDIAARVMASGFTGYPGLLMAMGIYSLLLIKSGEAERNAAAPCFALFHGFMRIGCTYSGCCYGIEVGWPLFHGRFPTQLMEAVFCLALFFVLQFCVRRRRMSVYLIAYGVFRFLVEFLRGDDRGQLIAFLPGSPAQQIAVLTIVGCGLSWAIAAFTDRGRASIQFGESRK